VKSN